MKFKLLLVATGMLVFIGSFAQSGDIVGKIIDRSNGLEVPFVSFKLLKDDKVTVTTSTDIDGLFKLKKIPTGTYSLRVNGVGYDSLLISDVTIKENTKLTMNLEVSLKNNHITEIIPIPPYFPKQDSLKAQTNDSLKIKGLPKR